MKWIEALKIWNKARTNTDRWCIPRKGTYDYKEVIKIMKNENVSKEPPKKEPEPPKKVATKESTKTLYDYVSKGIPNEQIPKEILAPALDPKTQSKVFSDLIKTGLTKMKKKKPPK